MGIVTLDFIKNKTFSIQISDFKIKTIDKLLTEISNNKKYFKESDLRNVNFYIFILKKYKKGFGDEKPASRAYLKLEKKLKEIKKRSF